MKKYTIFLHAFALLLALAACGAAPESPGSAEGEYSFTDDLGRTRNAVTRPERVAALIGSFADVWCLAGGHDTLVAAADDAWTSFDLGPRRLRRQPRRDKGALARDAARSRAGLRPCQLQHRARIWSCMDVLESAGITAGVFRRAGLRATICNMLDICTALTGARENYRPTASTCRQR